MGQLVVQHGRVPAELHEVLAELALVLIQDIELELQALLQLVHPLGELAQHGAQEADLLVLLGQRHVHLVEAVVRLLQELLQALEAARLQVRLVRVLVPDERASVLGVRTLDVLAFLEVGLQVHGQERGAAGVVGAPHGPVVAAALVLLAGAELDGEGAPAGVHLEGGGLPGPHRPAAVPAVDEELADLLGHRDVVHHHRQLGVVHGALL